MVIVIVSMMKMMVKMRIAIHDVRKRNLHCKVCLYIILMTYVIDGSDCGDISWRCIVLKLYCVGKMVDGFLFFLSLSIFFLF